MSHFRFGCRCPGLVPGAHRIDVDRTVSERAARRRSNRRPCVARLLFTRARERESGRGTGSRHRRDGGRRRSVPSRSRSSEAPGGRSWSSPPDLGLPQSERRGSVNEVLGQERAAQRAEIQVAATVPETLDNAVERWSGREVRQVAEPTSNADVTRREYVEATHATQ